MVQKTNRGPRWNLAPNGLQNSYIGIKGTEPIGWNTSVVFALDAGFDPYSLKLSSGPGSAAHNAGIPQNQQTAWADLSRAGQWYNGNGYVGVSSLSYGTLTVFRQNSLTYDGVLEYDPMGGSYAFSPIGWQGITCGGGNTENCRHTTSLKYRLTVGQARLAAIWQFGGYGQNNASNGAYQVGVGGDIPNLANGVLSVDAIYSYVRDSTAAAVAGGPTDVNGTPIPPFLPQALTLTISDNRAVMLLARYTNGPLKLYAGYEQIKYSAPSARGHVVAVTCLALEARIALGPGVSVICNHNSRLVASLEAAVKWRFGHHQFRNCRRIGARSRCRRLGDWVWRGHRPRTLSDGSPMGTHPS